MIGGGILFLSEFLTFENFLKMTQLYIINNPMTELMVSFSLKFETCLI